MSDRIDFKNEREENGYKKSPKDFPYLPTYGRVL